MSSIADPKISTILASFGSAAASTAPPKENTTINGGWGREFREASTEGTG
jgi:hypothetical protein